MTGAATGITMRQARPARAAYAAQAAPALPLVGIATPRTPSSAARDTPTAAPRALNVPVGVSPSSFISRPGRPIRAPYRGSGSSGVMPSPSDVTCAACRTGSISWYRHRVAGRAARASQVSVRAARSVS